MKDEKLTEKKTEAVNNNVSAEELAAIISMYQRCTPEMKKCVSYFMQGLLMAKSCNST